MNTHSANWLVGIDLGIKSKHKVALIDRSTGKRVQKGFSVDRTHQGAQELLDVLSQADSAEVFLEPTGNMWRPLAAVLITAGYKVYLVSTVEASRLRKALSRHAKSDRIDAETLARLPLVNPEG